MSKKELNNLLKLDIKDTGIKSSFLNSAQKKVLIEVSDSDTDIVVDLLQTNCHFGGHRYWFSCPGHIDNRKCGSRVRIIYRNNGVWGCRKCMNLTYRSRNLSGIQKLMGVDISLSKFIKTSYQGKLTKRYRTHLKRITKKESTVSRILLDFDKKVEKRIEKMSKN